LAFPIALCEPCNHPNYNLAAIDAILRENIRNPVWPEFMAHGRRFCRLRLGCIRWQKSAVTVSGTTDTLPGDAVCLLDIPVNETGTALPSPLIGQWAMPSPPGKRCARNE
jgi:hypothetical protein